MNAESRSTFRLDTTLMLYSTNDNQCKKDILWQAETPTDQDMLSNCHLLTNNTEIEKYLPEVQRIAK